MKKVISLMLSLVMIISITAGLDFSANAETNSSEIISVSAGYDMTALVRADGSLWTWGCGELAQHGSTWGNYWSFDYRNQSLGIAAGSFVESTPIMAFSGSTKSVLCAKQMTDTTFQSYYSAPLCAALKDDNSLWMWGGAKYGVIGNEKGSGTQWTPYKVLESVVSYDTSGTHSGAVTSDGSLYMWGRNSNGQIGNGTNDDVLVPTKIMDNVESVSLGTFFSSALKKDGSLWLWGYNNRGQLGIGTYDSSNVPVKVLENIKQVSLGDDFCLAVDNSGALYVWGYNYYGELGLGNKNDQLVPIINDSFDDLSSSIQTVEAGNTTGAVVLSDGSLYMWGSNGIGQIGDGSLVDKITPKRVMKNVKIVSIGNQHTIAVKNDNTVWTWGDNSYGQLGDRTTERRTSPVQIDIGRINASFQGDNMQQAKTLDIPWDDKFLYDTTTSYNRDMAISGIVLSEAAYSNSNVFNQFGYAKAGSGSSNALRPAFYIYYKATYDFGNPQVHIIMAIRGTKDDYGDDLHNDVESVMDSFDGPTNELMSSLETAENTIINKLKNTNISLTKKNTRLFITGHSLGGACAGKIGIKLIDDGLALPSNVYVYTYASPKNITDWNQAYIVPKCFNIINECDTIVPNLPTIVLPFYLPIRAGRDKYYLGTDSNRNFMNSLYQLYDEYPGDRYTPVKAHMTPIYLASILSSEPRSEVNKVFSRARVIEVHCPVDVAVYDSLGELNAYTQNGKTIYSEKSSVSIIVNDDEKYIGIPNEDEYTIKYIGTNSGNMTIIDKVYSLESGEIESEKVFEGVVLEEGKQFESAIDAEDTDKTDLYVIDSDGDKISSVDVNGNETNLYTYDITEHKIQISTDSYKYDGTAKTQTVSVEGLTEGTDYRVIYDNNIAVGTATVTVKGINDYYGRESKTFKIYDEGACSETVSWKLSPSGTLTITGSGDIPNYDAENPAPWSAHTETINKIVINDGITAIGDNAFSCCEKATEIYIPSSVTAIGNNATEGCSNLTSIAYAGTSDEWGAITVGEGNTVINNTEKTYSSTESGHVWDSGVITGAATCAAEGEMTYTCIDCSITKTEPIAKIAHSYVSSKAEPTCTEQGYTTYTCSECGDSYTSDFVSALSHDFSNNAEYCRRNCGEKNPNYVKPTTKPSAEQPTNVGSGDPDAPQTAASTPSTPVVADTIRPQDGASETYVGAVIGRPNLKVKAAKKSAKLSWNKNDGAQYYEIQYGTDKKFKKAKTKKVKASKTSVTLKKLTKGKKYYFRIRAVNGSNISAWSKKKSVKVK